MPVPNIVIGQRVEDEKVRIAKALRRAMTPEERILWQRLRGNRLRGLHFRRHQVIDGFVADFYCHAAALVVEVDGPIHAQQADYDRDRDKVLRKRGFRILRFTNEQVRNALDQVLARIAAAAQKS